MRKINPENAASLLIFYILFKKDLDLLILLILGLQIKGLQSYQLSKLEVSRISLPSGPLKLVSPVSSSTRVKPFSRFDGQQLCHPLTYRSHISIIERSKTVIKFVKISRGGQHFKGGICLAKSPHFNSVYLLRGRFVLLLIV